jgi:hypothetical protein
MTKNTEPDTKFELGVGVDCGTMNMVSARESSKGNVKTIRIRNAFIDLPLENKRLLRLSKKSYVEFDGRLLVIGDEAMETANLFNREARRPSSRGMISPGEIDAQQVMALILQQILGKPRAENEKCCFSVPAPAIDIPDSTIAYHTAILKKIISENGYNASPHNEGQAVIFSECIEETFSGIGISYGSGMTNVCLSYNAMSALEFSLARGGDYIDMNTAKAVNTTAAKICAIKESGIDISKPNTREAEALAVFIQGVIDYSIENIIKHFDRVKNTIHIPNSIPIVISGGTSLAKGFMDKFESRFNTYKDRFPVQISNIRHAKDPMTAVATGLLLLSQMEE